MKKTINAGVIGASISKEMLSNLSNNEVENISWKKLFAANITTTLLEKHPEVEVVSGPEQIISDTNIHLVFVSPSHLEFVNPAIAAGKSVRLI